MSDDDDVHLWEVRGSYPTGENKVRPSYSNLRIAVVARTMERVMAIVRDEYEGVRFHSIEKRNHLGKDSVLIDMSSPDEVDEVQP